MTSGAFLIVVQLSPENREVVHPCGSQRGSHGEALPIRR